MSDMHLDDETLSAVLDGEGTPAESAHADSCAACGTRLGALRDASVLVRSPVAAAPDAQRDAAIAAALGAAAAPSNVVPLRRRTPPVWLAAAAAAVLAVVGIAVFVPRGDDDSAPTAAGDADDSTAGAVSDEFATSMAQAGIDGGDLGEIDPASLRETIEAALSGGGAGTTRAADEAVTTTAADGAESAPSIMAAPLPPPCESELRASNDLLGPLVYHATGTIRGEPQVVLVFEVTAEDGSVDRWVYVAATADCAIRNQQTFGA
jgi:hypothetical protein